MKSEKHPGTVSTPSQKVKLATSQTTNRLGESEIEALHKLAKQRTKEIMSLLSSQTSQTSEHQVNDPTPLDSEKNTD